MSEVKNIAILGAGGLGRAAVELLDQKEEFRLVAICDHEGYAYHPQGLTSAIFDKIPVMTSVGTLSEFGAFSDDPIGGLEGI